MIPESPLRRLRRGDLLPRIVHPPPGPLALELSARAEELEAPVINALYRGRPNIFWREALGANVLDVDGNRYVDLTAGFGVAAIGHRHPAVGAAIRQQSARLVHGLGDAASHELRLELAAKLRDLAPIEEAQTYFAVSGADAVEIALKTAALATGKPGILAFDPAYHGLTLGALAATSRPAFRDPFENLLHAHLHRLPFGCEPSRVDVLLRRSPRIGVAIVEPVVGREGILIPASGWLEALAEACRSHGVLLAVDEIFTGFGRTGELFAVSRENVEPDLLCCGKALAGGMPLAAVLGRRSLMSAWRSPGEARHTATFVAHPLACAAALATLKTIEELDLPHRAARLGAEVGLRLAPWPGRFSTVEECRGRGLMWAAQLSSARLAGRLTELARQRGVLLLAGGPEGRVVQIVPPLTIHRRQLFGALEILEWALEELQGEESG